MKYLLNCLPILWFCVLKIVTGTEDKWNGGKISGKRTVNYAKSNKKKM